MLVKKPNNGQRPNGAFSAEDGSEIIEQNGLEKSVWWHSFGSSFSERLSSYLKLISNQEVPVGFGYNFIS